MKKDSLYFQHILEAINKIERYMEKISFEDFSVDDMRVGAVLRELSVIGEAANQMSDQGRKNLPSIPWPEMISMRNKIIHEYFGIDIETVWQTVYEDLPVLKQKVLDVLS